MLEACRAFYARKRRRMFVEYVMLAGVNDRYEQALALAGAARAAREAREPPIFKVNLIPYNPTDSPPIGGSGREAIAAFRAALEQRGVEATVRLTRGRDIDAACGQLAASRACLRGGMPRCGCSARQPRPVTSPPRDPRRRVPRRRAAAARAARSAPRASDPIGRCPAAPRSELKPNSFRNWVLVRYRTAPNWERPASSIRPRSSSVAAAESALTPRMRVISGRETGCR